MHFWVVFIVFRFIVASYDEKGGSESFTPAPNVRILLTLFPEGVHLRWCFPYIMSKPPSRQCPRSRRFTTTQTSLFIMTAPGIWY